MLKGVRRTTIHNRSIHLPSLTASQQDGNNGNNQFCSRLLLMAGLGIASFVGGTNSEVNCMKSILPQPILPRSVSSSSTSSSSTLASSNSVSPVCSPAWTTPFQLTETNASSLLLRQFVYVPPEQPIVPPSVMVSLEHNKKTYRFGRLVAPKRKPGNPNFQKKKVPKTTKKPKLYAKKIRSNSITVLLHNNRKQNNNMESFSHNNTRTGTFGKSKKNKSIERIKQPVISSSDRVIHTNPDIHIWDTVTSDGTCGRLGNRFYVEQYKGPNIENVTLWELVTKLDTLGKKKATAIAHADGHSCRQNGSMFGFTCYSGLVY